MTNKQQTAVEWLEKELKDRYPLMNSEPFFEQAKQMEKEQSNDWFEDGYAHGYNSGYNEGQIINQ